MTKCKSKHLWISMYCGCDNRAAWGSIPLAAEWRDSNEGLSARRMTDGQG